MTTSGRVLLADDSPHAQRMGERILREEGFEVVTVTDGETAIIRLKDVDPDVVIVDAFLPQVSGYDLCGYIKKQPQHSHVKVLLTSTALERVDEDQAYKAGADGQLKKPFEASVMLKSLKDLIGGSDKKKRTGTTSLSLSYNDEPSAAEPDSPAADSDADESPGEKPVSALQAWLQQHDSGSYAGYQAEEPPEAEELPEAAPVAAAVIEELAEEADGISNPQLLRKPEEEPEDLSLRNNPVARLRNAPPPSSPSSRLTVPSAEPLSASPKPEVRSFRAQPLAVPSEQAEAASASTEPARPPRKSLLEQLEEFEKAAAEGGPEFAATATFAKAEPIAAPAPDAPSGDAPSPESPALPEPAQSVTEEKAASAVTARTDGAVTEPLEDSEEDLDEDREEVLLIRSRTGRSSRPSLLEAIGASSDEGYEEDALEASHVEPREEVRAEPPLADPISVDAAEEVVVAATASTATTATSAASAAVTVSLNDAGVRLDEEEVRAVVEIAVSAAMPAIVEEVSRCVLLALESRYAEKVSVDEDR